MTYLQAASISPVVLNGTVEVTPSILLNTPDEIATSILQVDYSANLGLYPSLTLPVTANCSWVQDLYRITHQSGPQITLLMCNKQYLSVLINWLAYTALQALLVVKDTVILSLDNTTHQVLKQKGFNSVLVPRDSIIRPYANIAYISAAWVTRLTVIRVLNSFKYDVLSIDSDAMILKDMRPLFENFPAADIIASSGTWPFSLHNKWKGPTLCMGVSLFKATKGTGTCILVYIGFAATVYY